MTKLLYIATILVALCSLAVDTTLAQWTTLDPGLEVGTFPTGRAGYGGDATVTVLRADPAQWSLEIHSMTESEYRPRLSAKQWCQEYQLSAAINAGMFDVDYRTHVGYCAIRGHVNSALITEYQSVAATCAKSDTVPAFRLFDLDQPGVTIDDIRRDYDCVAQNLRLIKRPGEGRWSQQEKRWSEAALGEDSQGRILFIFCRTGYSMHDLNEILLSLPLDLVAAHHLEGGPEAQLYIGVGDFETEIVGSYETSFFENDSNVTAQAIPLVFGLRRIEP